MIQYYNTRQNYEKSACPKSTPVAVQQELHPSSIVIPVILSSSKYCIEFMQRYADTGTVIVLKISDYLSSDGKQTNSRYRDIVAAGGFNAYFGTNFYVILSLIMDDVRCSGLTPELVTQIIRELKADACTTFDDATYLDDIEWGVEKLSIVIEKNKQLVAENPEILFYGVVKGSTIEQVKMHVDTLHHLGIKEYIFHAGDFVARGHIDEIKASEEFALEIRKKADGLYIYGIGSKANCKRFYFADGVITLSHIIEPYYGTFTDGFGRVAHHRKLSKEQKTLDQFFGAEFSSPLAKDSQNGWFTFMRVCRNFETRFESLDLQTEITNNDLPRMTSLSLDSCICIGCTCLSRGCC